MAKKTVSPRVGANADQSGWKGPRSKLCARSEMATQMGVKPA